MKWDNKKSINKQYLQNEYKIPTPEAKERAEEMRLSKYEMNVFVDISELVEGGVFGLGVCYVGQDEVITKSKKYYDSIKRGKIQRAMIEATIHSLKEITNILNNRLYPPTIIMIYSTLDIKGTYLKEGNLSGSAKKYVLSKTNGIMKDLILNFPDIEFRFEQLDRSIKRYNPFYTAAHNAARSILKETR